MICLEWSSGAPDAPGHDVPAPHAILEGGGADVARRSLCRARADRRRRRSGAATAAPDLRAVRTTSTAAARFYFSDCFPDTHSNRALVASVLETIGRDQPVVLLNTPFALDDHRDAATAGGRVIALDPAHMSVFERLGGARLVPIAAGDLALLRGALAGVAATT